MFYVVSALSVTDGDLNVAWGVANNTVYKDINDFEYEFAVLLVKMADEFS